MNSDPWTADDPQPGEFDAVLETIGADSVQYADGDPDARMRILVSVDGEDARRLERLAEARGRSPHDVVVDLLREADRPAA